VNNGKIEQIGTPAQIVNHPATEFVAEFADGLDLERINTQASSPAAQQTSNLKIVS
jgi:ABC-type proline/glycine betaine transport system ATPase subunit